MTETGEGQIPTVTEEKPTPTAKTLDLTVEQKAHLLPFEVQIDPAQISSDRFREMLYRTNGEGSLQERGFMIASVGKGEIITTQIIAGQAVAKSESQDDHQVREQAPEIRFPSLPFGWRSLDPRLKLIALVHTHPKREQLRHLSAVTFSPTDISDYAFSNLHAAVMVEEGGIHLLTGRNRDQRMEGFSANDIFHEAINAAAATSDNNTIREVRKNIADKLYNYGIRYFFSLNISPSEDGYLHFKDVRTIDTQAKAEAKVSNNTPNPTKP